MAIFIVRHGETASNAARVVQTPETPLSERGIAQAQRLSRRLAELGVARILSSDLRRATMTAEPIAHATQLEIETDPVLQERNFGDIRGTPYAELGVDLFADDYRPPGGEDWEVFHARVDRAWARVREALPATDGNLAVITHGLVCRSLLRHLRLRDELALPDQWHNTSVTIVDGEPPWSVQLVNCREHLSDLRLAGGARA